jgi:hypothetical protein
MQSLGLSQPQMFELWQFPPYEELSQSMSLLAQLHVPPMPLQWLPFAAVLQSPLLLQPHVPLGRHTAPSAALPQPIVHAPDEQQKAPPLHGDVTLHVVEHVPLLQARPIGQSFAVSQPQAPVLHTWPSIDPEQSTHVPPLDAAQIADVSMVHADPPQQKPLPHVPSGDGPQAEVHVPLPQVGVMPPHGTHVWPLVPHAVLSVPSAHVPALQQPLLQTVAGGLHDDVHWPLLHALPIGQSTAPAHPQTVPMHL